MANLSHFRHGPEHLAYRSFGSGAKHILAFHGFGRTGEDFRFLEHALKDKYSLHAFDLHFHGHSPKPLDRTETPFRPDELATYFSAFADSLSTEKVTLMGYSLGGRIALSLLETMPQRIDQVILLAPDGLQRRPWYRVLAKYSWGRKLYRNFVKDPSRAVALVDLLHRSGLMNAKMHRFLHGQMDTLPMRQLVHNVWTAYRLLEPDLRHAAHQAERHRIPVHVLFGRYDRVIRTAQGKALRRHAPEWVRCAEVEAGHTLLTPALAEMLVREGVL